MKIEEINKFHYNLMDYPKFEDLKNFPGLLLWQVSHLWKRKLNAVIKKYNLTYIQFVMLNAIDIGLKNNFEITQINLARGVMMDIMMTSNVVRTLEEKALIVRNKHPQDSRAYLLDLTEKGYELVPKVRKTVWDFNDNFFNKIDDQLEGFKKNMVELINKNP